MEITKEEAAQIARTHLKSFPEWTSTRISEVCDLGELQSRPPAPYGVSKEALEEAWIVYLAGCGKTRVFPLLNPR